MAGSAALMLWHGRGTTFSGDELYYYTRLVDRGGHLVEYQQFTLEYVLAPHNSHLPAVGRLIYEALFATAGTDYFWYRLVEVAGILLCVALFFDLARMRIGPWAALAPSVTLLFFGFAWEPWLWPFDLHTVYSLAAGLGALCCLERDRWWAEAAACLLLVVSVATIELGLAFIAAVAVLVALGPDRFRRLWIVLVPTVLYGGWYVWARQFHQAQAETTDPFLLLSSIGRSLGAVLGSLLGLNPVGNGFSVFVVGDAGWPVLSVLFCVFLAVQIRRGPVRPFLWASMIFVLTYWAFIALAGRPPDSSRYMLAGAIGVLLVAAEAVHGRVVQRGVIAVLFLIALSAVPKNLEKLKEGRSVKTSEAMVNRIETGMEELARGHVNAAYAAYQDPVVIEAGGSAGVGVTAGQYLHGSDRVGPFGYSSGQVLDQDPSFRHLADVTLTRAMSIELKPARPPRDPGKCARTRKRSSLGVALALPQGGALLTSEGKMPVKFGIRRFGTTSVSLGQLRHGRWKRVLIPSDSSARRWEGLANGTVRFCRLGSS